MRAYLTEFKPEENVQVHYYAFLRHLFGRVKEELEYVYEGKDNAATYETLATSWREHLDTLGVCKALYQSVIDKAMMNHDSEPFSLNAAAMKAQQELKALLSAIDRRVESSEITQVNNVKVILYFNEAHVLATTLVLSRERITERRGTYPRKHRLRNWDGNS